MWAHAWPRRGLAGIGECERYDGLVARFRAAQATNCPSKGVVESGAAYDFPNMSSPTQAVGMIWMRIKPGCESGCHSCCALIFVMNMREDPSGKTQLWAVGPVCGKQCDGPPPAIMTSEGLTWQVGWLRRVRLPITHINARAMMERFGRRLSPARQFGFRAGKTICKGG
jgi:hypothetical protein